MDKEMKLYIAPTLARVAKSKLVKSNGKPEQVLLDMKPSSDDAWTPLLSIARKLIKIGGGAVKELDATWNSIMSAITINDIFETVGIPLSVEFERSVKLLKVSLQ